MSPGNEFILGLIGYEAQKLPTWMSFCTLASSSYSIHFLFISIMIVLRMMINHAHYYKFTENVGR